MNLKWVRLFVPLAVECKQSLLKRKYLHICIKKMAKTENYFY